MKHQKYYLDNDFIIKKMNPSLIIVFGYLVIIFSGTLLLLLPISIREQNSLNFIDSFFTATSAVCVTGLVVKDTATFFSPFGKLVILFLIQMGGFGYLMITSYFTIVITKKIDSNIRFQTLQEFQKFSGEQIRNYILKIFVFVFSIELIGGFILFFRFKNLTGNILKTIFYSIFHSVSAFCNAGFSTFSTNLYNFRNDPVILFTISMLIIIGGLGFTTLRDMKINLFSIKRIQAHSKIVLIMTSILIIVSSILFFLFENNNSLSEFSIVDKIFNSYFQVVTPRTAGFNSLDFALLHNKTIFLIIILMFIGGSPGGTAGGIKTTTFYIVVSHIINSLKGRENLNIFKKRIDEETIKKSYFIFNITILILTLSIFILLITENQNPFKVIFEVFSAYGTVGLSVGGELKNVSLSANFTPYGKIVIIFLMLVGRVGILTAINIFLTADRKEHFLYPKTKVIVG